MQASLPELPQGLDLTLNVMAPLASLPIAAALRLRIGRTIKNLSGNAGKMPGFPLREEISGSPPTVSVIFIGAGPERWSTGGGAWAATSGPRTRLNKQRRPSTRRPPFILSR